VALLSIFINLTQLAAPAYMFTIFCEILINYSRESLISVTVVAYFAAVSFLFFHYLRKRLLISAGRALNLHIRTPAFEKMVQGYALQDKSSYTQGLNDLEILKSFFTGQAATALFDIPWAPLYLILILLLSPIIGLVTTSGVIIMISLNILKHYLVRENSKQAIIKNIETQRFISASLLNFEVISAMGMAHTVSELYDKMNRDVIFHQTISNKFTGSLNSVLNFLQQMVQILTYFTGGYLAIMHLGSSFSLVVVISMMTRMASGPFMQIINMWEMLVTTKEAYNRVQHFMNASDEKPELMTMPQPSGILTVTRATCRVGNTLLLRGITFTLNHGEFLGIIGPGGAGKSTLCRIILGIWPTHSGKVLLDGMETFLLDREKSGQYIGYLPQEIELFPATVAENIARLGTVEMDKVVIAAQLCGLDKIIENMADGYHTRLEGVDGLTLSGGQKQRLGMARAVYGDPSLIVLDEPTSNLDADGEMQFLKTLNTLKEKKNCTCIMVTHKPELLISIDKVLMMQNGISAIFGSRESVFKTLFGSKQVDGSKQVEKEVQKQ